MTKATGMTGSATAIIVGISFFKALPLLVKFFVLDEVPYLLVVVILHTRREDLGTSHTSVTAELWQTLVVRLRSLPDR